MTDDASAEIEAIRSSFNCRILLCIWHVRRAWLKNVYRGNTCKHVLKILDLLRRNKTNEQEQGIEGVTLLVDDDHDVRGSLSHENITTDSCVQLEDQDVSGVVIGEVQRTDSCVQLEDQDVSGVVIGEDQRTERVKPGVSREIRVGYALMGPLQLIGRRRRDGIAWDGGDRMEKAGMAMRQRAILSAA
ncbi:hypothetical protein SUGI_0297710 [Cryptomeria japonica]|nr:hypothetical protein SUGI_0297710 [Cryptomeria japonica]